MNKIIKSEVKRYLKNVKGSLPCSFSAKATFISMLKAQICDFIDKFPDSSIDDVINQFGTPEAIASEFDVNDYTAAIKKYKIKTAFLVLLSAVLLICCIFLVVALKESVEDGYVIVSNDFDTDLQK